MEATGGIEEEMDLEIHSSHFYSKGTTRQEGSEVYEVFSRQEHAFQFFDSFVEGNKRDKNDSNTNTNTNKNKEDLKIFSLESLRDGRRKFIVADMDTFVNRYTKAAAHNR